MSIGVRKESFLAALLAKYSLILAAGQQADFDPSALVREVERQIDQVAGKDIVKGKGVTKSGEEN